MTDHWYLLKTSEIYALENRKLCPWFNVDNYLRGMKHMWPCIQSIPPLMSDHMDPPWLKEKSNQNSSKDWVTFYQRHLRSQKTIFHQCQDNNSSRPPGGGGTPLYKLYRNVPPHWLGFLRRFGLKTGIHFAHFCLESGIYFSRELREGMNVFIVSIPNE